MESSIVAFPCLRGGGADYKRKEARKRKFAHLQDDHAQTSSTDENKHKSAPARALKKRKPSPSALPNQTPKVADETKQTEDEADSDHDIESAKAGQDGDHVDGEDEQAKKAQRFIVFIGNQSTIFAIAHGA